MEKAVGRGRQANARRRAPGARGVRTLGARRAQAARGPDGLGGGALQSEKSLDFFIAVRAMPGNSCKCVFVVSRRNLNICIAWR